MRRHTVTENIHFYCFNLFLLQFKLRKSTVTLHAENTLKIPYHVESTGYGDIAENFMLVTLSL